MCRLTLVGTLWAAAACAAGDTDPPAARVPFDSLVTGTEAVTLHDTTTFELPLNGLVTQTQVLVVDRERATVRVFDRRTGRALRTVGRPGDRPGDFRSPVAIAPSGAYGFAVLDNQRLLLSVRDSAGALEHEVEVDGFWTDMIPGRSPGEFVLAGSVHGPGAGNLLHEVDVAGKRRASFLTRPKVRSKWEASFSHGFVARLGDSYLWGRFASNRVLQYAPHTEAGAREVAVGRGWFSPLKFPPDGASQTGETAARTMMAWVRSNRLLTGLFPLTGGRFVARFQLYDSTGRATYAYAVTDTTSPLAPVSGATPRRIVQSRGDTVYWIQAEPTKLEYGAGVVRADSRVSSTSPAPPASPRRRAEHRAP